MSRPWLRLYREVIDDPKVGLLSDGAFRLWVQCLCIADEKTGLLPSEEPLAFSLRRKRSDLTRQLQILQKAGLIDHTSEGLAMHGWSNRQFESDVSRERVRAFRKRRGNVSRNVTVTVQDSDTDTDTDTEKKRGVSTQKQERAAQNETPPPPLLAEHDIEPLRQVYSQTDKALIPEDWSKASYPWRQLDFEQRQKVTDAASERVTSGVWTDPAFIPKPAKFIESGEWKRPVQLPRKRTPRGLTAQEIAAL